MRFPGPFWAQVSKDPSGCWLWQGRQNATGYGRVDWYGHDVFAHRLAYELTYGPVPKDICVLHTCDVRHCVNPEHLWLGTRADNAADCDRKDRRRPQKG